MLIILYRKVQPYVKVKSMKITMKERITTMLIGSTGYVLGYLVFYTIFYGNIPYFFYSLLSNFAMISTGLILVSAYFRRMLKSLEHTLLIAFCFSIAVEFARMFSPFIDIYILCNYLGSIDTQWMNLPVIRSFLGPEDFVFGVLFSFFFVFMILLFNLIKKRKVFLIFGFFFLIISISKLISSIFLYGTLEKDILFCIISGGLYCYLAWYFLYDNQEIQGGQIKETWNSWNSKRNKMYYDGGFPQEK